LPQQVPMHSPGASDSAFTPPPSIPGLNLGPDGPSLPESKTTSRSGGSDRNKRAAGVDTASPDDN